jgi:drug/metabolite transporter (DMT)-like permease
VLDPRLLPRLARQPVFLAALALNGVGFLLHVAALETLPLFFVQAVIAGSVAVTALLSVRVLRTPLGRPQQAAVALVVLGLVLLGLSAGTGEAEGGAVGRPIVLLGVVLAIVAVAAVVRRRPGAAVVLGLLAGTGFGVVAVCARLLPDGARAVLTSSTAGVLVLAGTVAFVVYSAAMQRGSVTTATAAMVVTQTVVPAVAGLLLGDRVREGFVPLALLGFGLALLGALGLGRYDRGLPAL